MSKYITHFQTEAEYQTALPSLDLPNVSLVDELGEVHYHRALYGAHAGDICLYDVAEAQKIVVTAENWNIMTYPTENYPIIGVVVMDETAAGFTVMSNWLIGTDGSQSSTDTEYKWQSDAFIEWGLTEYDTEDLAKTDFNGKANTAAIINAIKAYDTSNGTDNITGNIGDIIQKYHTEGTIAGDWYIPAVGEAYKLYENRTTLLASFNKINTASSSAGLSGSVLLPSNECWSSSEYSNGSEWVLNPSNGDVRFIGKNFGSRVRAFATFNS